MTLACFPLLKFNLCRISYRVLMEKTILYFLDNELINLALQFSIILIANKVNSNKKKVTQQIPRSSYLNVNLCSFGLDVSCFRQQSSAERVNPKIRNLPSSNYQWLRWRMNK